jgi:hypothetical protein
MSFIEIGARLSPFLRREFANPAIENLRHVEVFANTGALVAPPADDHLLLYDLIQKALLRGRSPFVSYAVEKQLIGAHGTAVGLVVCEEKAGAPIEYAVPQSLVAAYNAYSDFLSSRPGDLADVPLDPENPQNERRLLSHLREALGDRLPHALYPQFDLSVLLGEDFSGQHGDFLIALPNGKALILEPGNHDTADEQIRDGQRDRAFAALGIETLRCRNEQIGEAFVRTEIVPRLEQLGAIPFFQTPAGAPTAAQLAMSRLFLLPSLVARVEWLLNDALLLRGLFGRETLKVAVVERDLPVFELALWSFVQRLQTIISLYGMEWPRLPQLDVSLCRAAPDPMADSLRHALREFCRISETGDVPPAAADLTLDLAITCNRITPPVSAVSGLAYAVRNAFPFKQPFALRYRSRPRPIVISDNGANEAAATTFLRDFFRKSDFRDGQWAIISHVLQQKDTIGLLPTSAGKSICYQLASLLTPGTTLVVAPTTALIDDQVQGLKETYGIDRVIGWHSGARIAPQGVEARLSGCLMLFVSPERLLRPDFRSALNALHASDIFINYTVADEAHCVSMWGQDFRPSYLNLKYNFIEYCTFQGHKPVTVALTGTASQLVLIDLKTILDIPDMDAIVRPKSFNRDELHFGLVRCPNDNKLAALRNQMGTVAHRLGIQELRAQGWGIIFAYTPRELWPLFGQFIGNEDAATQTLLTQIHGQPCPIGIVTGSKPDAVNLTNDQWKDYTRKTMEAMKRGDVRMLFGNTTVSVGVDCDRVNYVINLRMPQSMEAFYQQCGRAGRRGQHSECVQLFSDDNPTGTQQWLATRQEPARTRWDDIGSVMFFHGLNFPGKDPDFNGASAILDALFARIHVQDGRVLVHWLNDNTERYISYALILGISDDYEVTGGAENTVYRVRLHPAVRRILETRDADAGRRHLCVSLHSYLSRYRPCTLQEIEALFNAAEGVSPRQKALQLLLDFIYERIEQRRVASIRTMVSFCNMQDTSDAHLKKTIAAYFDRSEKFAPLLDAMAAQRLAVDLASQVLDLVSEFDDVENLFWETRRFLDEQFRADFALLNLFAILYRERTVGGLAVGQWRETLAELGSLGDPDFRPGLRLLGVVLHRIGAIGGEAGPDVGIALVCDLVETMYEASGLKFVGLVDELDASPDVRMAVQAGFVLKQSKEVLHASRFEQVA